MKIAIISDMHIGYERFREDAYAQAKRAIEMASSIADAILIPGDIFDKRIPSPEVISEAIRIFKPLKEVKWSAEASSQDKGRIISTKIPVIAISGTHERTAVGRENAVKVLDLAGLIIDTSELTTIISKNGEKVAVFGLGGISEEIVKEKLEEIGPRPIKGAFNIFMFHQSVYEFLPFSEHFIRLSDLPKGFDLYVDGHLHSKLELNINGKKFLIPGSTVITQLKDGEQGSKGFILFDTEKYTYDFISINSRPFFSKSIDITGLEKEEIRDKINHTFSELIKSGGKPIIRIKLEGKIKNGLTATDIGVKNITSEYADQAIIDLDASKIQNTEAEEKIELVRDSKMGGMSLREKGMEMLKLQLTKNSFSMDINLSEFMYFLVNGPSKKDKLVEEALRIFEHD